MIERLECIADGAPGGFGHIGGDEAAAVEGDGGGAQQAFVQLYDGVGL